MKVNFTKPTLVMMYGRPGAGKSAFARQMSEMSGAAHVHSDRIRYELYDDASFSPNENQVVLRLSAYLAETVMSGGQSLFFDMHLPSQKLRDDLRRMAKDSGYESVLLWLQIDEETARYRSTHRDRRRPDDRYSFQLSSSQYDKLAANAKGNFRHNEHPIVLSGKHLFKAQAAHFIKRLQAMGLLALETPLSRRGRVDYQRRTPSRPIVQ